MFDNICMATLRQFIDRAGDGKTDAQWADEIGISRSHFTMIRLGTAMPGRKVIQRIAEVTNGEVDPASWYETGDAA